MFLEHRLRIRNADDTADALTISSVIGDAAPYLKEPPKGDGSSFNPLTGDSILASYTGQIVDAITSGTDRVVTSALEDATARQQLGNRKAFVEMRTDGGTWTALIAGRLTLFHLIDDLTWEYTVTDPMSLIADYKAFQPIADETILDFLARWPNRGCIAGGPIIGGLGTIPDLGGWDMYVKDSANVHGLGTSYQLALRVGYGPASNWMPKKIDSKNFEDLNSAVSNREQANTSVPAPVAITTLQDVNGPYARWAGVVVLVNDPATPDIASATVCIPTDAMDFGPTEKQGDAAAGVGPISDSGIFVHGPALTVSSDSVKVRMLTVEASDSCPVYWNGHPVDLIDTLLTEAGVSVDATARETCRGQLGADRRITLRVTSPQALGTFLRSTLFGPLGIALRSNDVGDVEMFSTRVFANTPPATTITDADVIEGATGLPFELDTATAIHKVSITHNRLRFAKQIATRPPPGTPQVHHSASYYGLGPIPASGLSNPAPDGVAVQAYKYDIYNADPGSVGYREQDYTIDAMLHAADSWSADITDIAGAIAKEIFDRWGRGIITAKTTFLRGGAGDAVKLGDEIILSIAQLPNANKRLGDDASVSGRAMQVIGLTEVPEGREVILADSGPNAQPLVTKPTLSIAASSDLPRTVAEVTITNAATLNGLGYGCRVQMAITSGATPASTDYCDLSAWAEAHIPTGAERLRMAIAGRTVWIRARSEVAGSRPSDWSSVVHVTLSAIDDPTSVVATPDTSDASLCALTWVPGANATNDLVDIWLRASGIAFAAATRVATLDPGSVQFTLEGLTNGAAYIASVQHRDAHTGDVSDPVDIAFVAGSTVRTLAAPVDPNAFAGSIDQNGVAQADGSYGLAVVAAEFPGTVEFSEAIETAIGSGAFGSYAVVATAPSVQGNWTLFRATAPNDGLTRRLRARHIGDGLTGSSYTATADVIPWTLQNLPGYAAATTGVIFCEATAQDPSPIGLSGKVMAFKITGIDPSGGTPTVKLVSLDTSGVSLYSGPAIGVDSPNNTVWYITQPATGTGPGTVTFEADSGGLTAQVHVVIPAQSPAATPQGTVTIVPSSSTDKTGTVTIAADGPGNAVSARVSISTTGFPSDSSTASSGTVVSGRSINYAPGTITLGQTVYCTVIFFDSTFGTGTQLLSLHLIGTFQSFRATKTQYFSAASGMLVEPDALTANASPWNDATYPFATSLYANVLSIQNVPPASGSTYLSKFTLGFPQAQGCTLTDFRANILNTHHAGGTAVGSTIKLKTFTAAGSSTDLGSVSTSGMVGWNTVGFTLSSATDGQRYQIYVETAEGGIDMAGFYITWTMPSADASL